MAKGIVNEALPYVLEADKDLPDDQRTTFFLRTRSSKEVTQTVVAYAKAERVGRGGGRNINETAYNRADLSAFAQVVERVEQFFFGVPSPEDLHEKYLKEGVGEKVTSAGRDWVKVKTIEGENLRDVWRVISIGDMNELLEASNDVNKLSFESKKA